LKFRTFLCELTPKCSSRYVSLFQSILDFHQLGFKDLSWRPVAEALARRRLRRLR
jgi:hypothetical protein